MVEQRKVKAMEVSVLDDVSGEAVLTLTTCDDNGVTRLLTDAAFVDQVSIEGASSEVIAAFDLELSNQPR